MKLNVTLQYLIPMIGLLLVDAFIYPTIEIRFSALKSTVSPIALLPEQLPEKKRYKVQRNRERIEDRFERNYRAYATNDFADPADFSDRYKYEQLSSIDLTARIKKLGKSRSYDELHKIASNTSLKHNVYTYTAIITSFALSTLKDREQIVLNILEKMMVICKPNSYTITALFLTVDGGEEAIKLLDMAKSRYDIDPGLAIFNSAIKACSRKNVQKGDRRKLSNYMYALQFYEKILESNFEPDVTTFGNLLHVMSVERQSELALEVWSEMEELKIKPNQRCYGAILRACAFMGNVAASTRIFNSIPNGMVNVLHLNCHLACLAHNKVKDVKRSLQLIEQYSHMMDIITINTVLSACARKHTVESYQCAKTLFSNMKDGAYKNIQPDVISYNNLIGSCSSPVDILEIVKEMRLSRKFRRYDFVEPSPVTYTNAIKACSMPREPSSFAVKNSTDVDLRHNVIKTLYNWANVDKRSNYFVQSAMLHSMAGLGLSFEIESFIAQEHISSENGLLMFNSLFRSLSYSGDERICEKIKHYYGLMLERSEEPSHLTFRYLRDAIAKIPSNGEQVELINDIICLTDRKLISPVFLDFCIRVFMINKDEERAYWAFKLIPAPTSQHYNTLLSYLPSKSKHLRTILDKIPIVHLVFMDIPTMTNVIRKSLYLREYEKVDLYVDMMLDNLDDEELDSNSANRLIYILSQHNPPSRALDIFQVMPQKNINFRTYQNTILACQRGSKAENDPIYFESALSLLRRMEESGLNPTKEVFSSVISTCCAVGNWQAAFAIFSRYKECRNVYCLNSALAVCCSSGAWLEALEIYEKYKTQITPNFVTINTLIIALLAKGKQVELAANVYQEAVNSSLINHWKLQDDNKELMDLHYYSTSMAQIAVYSVLNSLLSTQADVQWDVNEDLIIIVGRGKESFECNDSNTAGHTSAVGNKVLDVLEGYRINNDFVEGNYGRIIVKAEDLRNYVSRFETPDVDDPMTLSDNLD